MSKIKIFSIDSEVWVAAFSKTEALLCLAGEMGYKDLSGYLKDYPDALQGVEPLTDKAMQSLIYVKESGAEVSFTSALEEVKSKAEDFPQIFAYADF